MTKPTELPAHLVARPFTLATALGDGVQPAQLRRRALQRPIWGVRSVGLDPDSMFDRCRAYSARMSPHAVFSHTTAALLWQLPMPLGVDMALHLTVGAPHRAPAGAGVVGHQQRLPQDERTVVAELAVASPAATWAQLADLLGVDDLTAIGEHIITGNPYEKRLPLAQISDLATAIAVREGTPGHRIRSTAFAQMREGALSRPETFVRLLITRCGIPDPLVNADVFDSHGRFLAMPDLQWPDFRVALEYHGDHHRGQRQFRDDISRLEKLIDAGWLVVQVTASELYGDPRVIVERVASRLRARGWQGRVDLRRMTTFVP